MKWTLIFFLSLPAFAQSEREILNQYRQRYENFFERRREEKSRDQKRLAGRAGLKESRQERAELLERARKRFVLSKPPPKDDTKAFQRHLAKELSDKKAMLKREENYAQERRKLDRIKSGALKIPPVLEYELQDAL